MLHELSPISSESFPRDSAGRRMTQKVPVICVEETIAEVEKLLEKEASNFDTINYIYVIDRTGKLLNVISIKELFRSPSTKKNSDFSQKKLVTVRAHTDQERVALLALEHRLKAVPVVDKDDHLVGVVPSDEILKILDTENIEDALRFAGVSYFDKTPYEAITAPAVSQARARLVWLILGLVGGLVAAGIVSFFENAIKTELTLAMFMPLVVYMSDAVGTQTQTIFVRSLAIDHRFSLWKYLGREFKIGLMISLVCSILLTLLSLWQGNVLISVILGTTLFIALTSAVLVAFGITLLLFKLKKDPAVGAGPFATIVQDILSLVIYFAVATLFLRMFA